MLMLSADLPFRRAHLVLLGLCTALTACGGNSRYQGLEADQLFQIATTEMEEGNYENAAQALDRLLVAHGDWDRLPEARLMLANAYFAEEDYLTARSEYGRFLDRYAGNPGAPDAALGVCKSLAELAPKPQRDQAYTQQAMTACRNVVVDFAGRPQAAEAASISNELRKTLAEKEYLNADFYFRRGLFDSAIKYFQFVVNLYPESEFAPQALLGLYRSNEAIGYQDLADEARDRLLSDYPDSDAAAEVRTDDSGS